MSEASQPVGGAAAKGGGQGRLAAVLARRGGKADPEAPFVIEHREALIYMLCQAAELEHGIMCQYLFAAFSLKQGEDEGLSAKELEAVTRWRGVIAHVASEEMLHLALVHNLLSAIGAAPHFARPNLPAPAHHYPAGVQLALRPFGEPALQHFMFLERPEGMQLSDAEGFAKALDESRPLMAEGEIVPRLQDFATVGHLYRSIEQGIAHLGEKFGESWLFVGPPKAQATSTDFSWPELTAVTDLASAQRAIDTILEQGEGARGHWQHAHFGQFVEILDEYRQMREANPELDPVRPVLVANVRPNEHFEDTPLIGDPLTARCADLFNVGYEVLLQTLERYFAHTEETDAQLATLADATVAIMLRVLKPLGGLLTTLPVGAEHPGMTAGPSFELFYETDYLMPHREAAWTLLEERLRDAGTFCERLRADCPESLAAALAPVDAALGDIADTLAAHFSDWGAVSRYLKDAPTDPGADSGDLDARLSRAAELAAAAAAAPLDDQAARDVAKLIGEVYELLLAVTDEAKGATPTSAARNDRPGAGEIAARLVDSVLRPLAEALTAPAKGDAAKGQAAKGHATKAATAKKPAQEEHARKGHSPPSPTTVWALALGATELWAGLAADAPLAAALAEAVACLQDLAIRTAPADGPDSSATRLTTLSETQAQLRCAIKISPNGPYLLTNAASMHNWLGEELPLRPQMALCRCGASATKPFCDGTHASIGFTDEKDPKRVPDQLDNYVGQQVTILDNRGICQHSGFCTDRLATAFRVDTEPFVAPSGGRMDELIRAVRDCPSGALSYALDGVEARAQVDWEDAREAGIEVSKDGPYRITGSIPLTDEHGDEVARNAGASREHYALCRCGHSQNKPFCSGMHWYVDFKDPVPDPDRVPTIFEWCGGLPALTRMTRLFYEKHVPGDPLLAPLFANMAADHPERVAKWLGEVFGGPKRYSTEHGGYQRMISQHLGKALSEEQRARWVELICRSAREAGLPSDAEFSAAFTSYVEWGSRLALENSQPGAKPPPQMPMPRWWWACDATPGSRVSALEPDADEDSEPVALPAEDEPVSFEPHVKSLFRERDKRSMQFAFDLWSHADVSQHADAILERLENGSMPCDGAWPPEKIAVFRRWTQSGKRATPSGAD